MTVWLITGCSTGFGKEIAIAALKKGDTVIATCRKDVTRLSDLEKAGAITLELDITASTEAVKEFVAKVLNLPKVKANGGVDILVNNAGYVQMGGIEEVSEEELMACFNTNFFGHIRVIKALLPHFREKRAGTVATVGSISGFMPYPAIGNYGSAKHALAGISASLAMEVEAFNIRVFCIEPGHFRTVVFKGTNNKLPSNPIADYENTIVGETMRQLIPSFEQPGDPVKGSQKIVDLLRGDWPAASQYETNGRKLPTRIVLGDDGFELVNEIYGNRLKENEEWKEWICGTSY